MSTLLVTACLGTAFTAALILRLALRHEATPSDPPPWACPEWGRAGHCWTDCEQCGRDFLAYREREREQKEQDAPADTADHPIRPAHLC